MASHYCLDPNDAFSHSEVLVVFEGAYPNIRLLSVTDQHEHDILPDLMVEQRRDLMREVAAFYQTSPDTTGA
ncbi:hypothetical protein [Methylobacterium sp. CM6247]